MTAQQEQIERFVRAMETSIQRGERDTQRHSDLTRQLEAALGKSPAEVAKLIDDASARIFFDGPSQRVTADRLRYIMDH